MVAHSDTRIVADEPSVRVGYLELIHLNRDFRNLWLGQVVSELGDWFSIVALFNLLLELTGRAQVVGWFLIIIHVPSVITGPLGGVLVDRLDRKRLMIAMDVARAVLVLGYLMVERGDQVWLVYLIAALETAMATLFEPARTASIPNICRRGELVAANAISSLTWSTMLTIGAAIGGLIATAFGRQVCFIVDSLSFVVSALYIRRVRIPSRRRLKRLLSEEPQPGSAAVGQGLRRGKTEGARSSHRGRAYEENPSTTVQEAGKTGLREILDGFRYLRDHPTVLALALVKTGWCLGGGLLLVLSVFGQNIFPVMGSGAAGIGLLFAARGVGTALGPIAARRLAGERQVAMRGSITAGFFMGSVFYILFGQAPWLPLAALALVVAHMGGSITWVFSTVLLQIEVPDKFRGRVFATELALLTLAIALSNYFAGYGLDVLRLSPRTVASILGLYFAIPGLAWIASQRLFRT